jgi:hypothetical protein
MSGSTRPKKPSAKPNRTERISQFSTPVDDETLHFIQALERFKADRGRAFPTWTEVLTVLKSLGYERKTPPSGPPRS